MMMDSMNESNSINQLQEEIRTLTDENAQLRDRNEALFSKLGSVQNKLGQQAASKSDLSVKLVQCEEEKLKISKDLVDVRIESNKMREQFEGEIFEFKNMVLSLEGTISALQTERDRVGREVSATSARLEVMERTERDLAEELAVLKSKFRSLSTAYEREHAHFEELSEELLSLAQMHDTLLQERERTHRHTLEVEKVRALLSRASQNRIRDVHNIMKVELEKLKKSYEEQQRQLEDKVVALGKEQQENKKAIQYTRHKLTEQSATLMISQHQLKESEAELSKVQNHLKALNREYRARLARYIQDVTECVTAVGVGDTGHKLKGFVESMLEEMKASYRSREEQLTRAVRTSRKRILSLNNTYQRLLIAYREQREQILALPVHALDAGPPEAHFSPAGSELRGETERELQRLRDDKARLESQLRQAQEQLAVLSESQRSGLTQEAWNDIKKQLTEMTNTTQDAQERERAQLITRSTVAEEQLSELKEYVDNHLGRYKLEITLLRRRLGSNSAGVCKPLPLH
ncbi:coiled-coil domain-containing protein 78 isoform X3 [Triplophysa dalaica]|uniref:coiled-coil domain-containing protein 78 isoform X3 n=1 Tax=Triplophysa dalaica TaxID=1582913 RepID=UPI0024DF8982|nr:coiled-coil domain-containing protein 78 isoform X3 [Triplophysa dalaica]